MRDLSAEVRRLQSDLNAERSVRADAEQLIEEKNAELGNNAGERLMPNDASDEGYLVDVYCVSCCITVRAETHADRAVVFKMHYEELLSKDDEIRKLRAMLSAVS